MSRIQFFVTLVVQIMAKAPGSEGPENLGDFKYFLKQPDFSSVSKQLHRLEEAPMDATVFPKENQRRFGYRALPDAFDAGPAFESTRRIKRFKGAFGTVAITFLTGHSRPVDRQHCLESGSAGFRAKAMRAKDLETRIPKCQPFQTTQLRAPECHP